MIKRDGHILGISCFYHDSAACLVKDGNILAAAQEERFTRKKHDPRFPNNAIQYCLREGRITVKDLHYFVYYDKPFLTFERLLFFGKLVFELVAEFAEGIRFDIEGGPGVGAIENGAANAGAVVLVDSDNGSVVTGEEAFVGQGALQFGFRDDLVELTMDFGAEAPDGAPDV